MIKIGNFSKLSQLSVKTLRYYDEIGLLKPASVDQVTGYRCYAASQLPRLRRILALKELGLSLQQIGMLLDGDLPSGQIIGMLRRKQVELIQEIQDTRSMLERVEARLRQFEQENSMPEQEILIKSVPAMWITSVRGTVPTYPDQGVLWEQLMRSIRKADVKVTGPCFTIDHDEEYTDTDHDLEVCYQIKEQTVVEPPVQVRELPAVENMASLIHHGSFATLHQSYQQMLAWLDENGCQICGPGREIYLSTGENLRQDDPSYVTEIQFPVTRTQG